jgi:alkylation response protein AidB-like acyl-CoA dehydrogenase
MRTVSNVELDLGQELAEFRRDIRAWIAANAPAGLAGLADWYDGATIHTASNRDPQAQARRTSEYEEWDRRLTAEHLIYPHWPVHAGGKGWTDVQLGIFAEECHRAGVPRIKRGFGADLVSTAILLHGTTDQQQRLLPRIVNGLDRYCQGFSEPNHGSDLGAIETVGVVDGDEIVITGQKVWTSEFEPANLIFLLCRTDPTARRDSAISFVIVPFEPSNGIVIRGIRQPTGAAEFGEEFFDGARAPLGNVIGGIGNGWEVAMSTLTRERTIDLLTMHLGYADEIEALVDSARRTGAIDDPLIRQRLARSFIDTQVMRAQSAEVMANAMQGDDLEGLASGSKLFWSEHSLRVGELAMDVLGSAAFVRPTGDELDAEPVDDAYALNRWQDLMLASRAGGIYSGTNEVQRNIIAERALGLPREPRGAATAVVRSGSAVRA